MDFVEEEGSHEKRNELKGVLQTFLQEVYQAPKALYYHKHHIYIVIVFLLIAMLFCK